MQTFAVKVMTHTIILSNGNQLERHTSSIDTQKKLNSRSHEVLHTVVRDTDGRQTTGGKTELTGLLRISKFKGRLRWNEPKSHPTGEGKN